MNIDELPLFVAARSSDPATSQVNRDAFLKKASQRDLILATYFRVGSGLTDEECGLSTQWKDSNMFDHRVCYWKRCSELRKLGFITPTGETRISSAGQPQQVCEITRVGREYVSNLLGAYA